MFTSVTADQLSALNSSGAPVADGNFIALDNYRYFPYAL